MLPGYKVSPHPNDQGVIRTRLLPRCYFFTCSQYSSWKVYGAAAAAPQDEQCATISVTVSGYSITPKPAGFPNSFTSSYQVCWYRHDGQASADFNFLQCSDICE